MTAHAPAIQFAADKEALLSRMARLLAAARDARMMVIYVVAGFRAGYPEISRRNMLFGALEGVWNLRRGGGRHGNSRI